MAAVITSCRVRAEGWMWERLLCSAQRQRVHVAAVDVTEVREGKCLFISSFRSSGFFATVGSMLWQGHIEDQCLFFLFFFVQVCGRENAW